MFVRTAMAGIGLFVMLGLSSAETLAGTDDKPIRAKKGEKGRADGGRMLDRLDPDGDGKVVLNDVPERMRERLTKLDKDGDGVLTRAEMAAGRPQKGGKPNRRPIMDPKQILGRFDVNGDDKLEGDEIPDRMRDNLARVDKNGDGAVDKEELKAAAEAMKRMGGRRGGDKKAEAGMNPEVLFDRLDANKDGKLDKEELKSAKRLPVGRLDANGDGELTKEEVKSKWAELERYRKALGDRGGVDAAVEAKQAFSEQDADADGRVTKKEAKGELAAQFDILDTDKDGQLSLQEVENQAGNK